MVTMNDGGSPTDKHFNKIPGPQSKKQQREEGRDLDALPWLLQIKNLPSKGNARSLLVWILSCLTTF